MGHNFLILAYVITWTLQLGYAAWLILRAIQLDKKRGER